MPVYRDADGNIIEEKSKQTDLTKKPLPPAPTRGGESAGSGGSDEPTVPGERPAQSPGRQGAGRLEEPTKPMGEAASRPIGRGAGAKSGEKHTRIHPVRRPKPRDEHETAAMDDAMDDPVVGWLAIIDGPGKGRAMQLGYGSNAVGRGETARVRLDFGDDQISRGGHAVVTYDPRGRKYYVQHGGGKNLTYLNDQPVLTPTELPAHSHIHIGSTVLRFVPLCNDAFDWQDTDESGENG